MESSNDSKVGHSMEHHLTDHQVPLSLVCLISLLFGVPLAWNMLWHLRVANGGSGDRNKKGVLQLILQVRPWTSGDSGKSLDIFSLLCQQPLHAPSHLHVSYQGST